MSIDTLLGIIVTFLLGQAVGYHWGWRDRGRVAADGNRRTEYWRGAIARRKA